MLCDIRDSSSIPHNNNEVGSYTYDAVGNRKMLISTIPPAGGNSYDFENHLITHGGVTIVYDGDGNRVGETVAGPTTNYLVDTGNSTG